MSEYKKTCWILTEGIAGTENQCLGLAAALGVAPVVKRLKLRFPWQQLAPWLPGMGLAAGSDSLEGPYPDILIASGRKSVGAALAIKKKNPKTFLVQVQDPRVDARRFDLVIVPQHDPVRGENVFVTKGALHRVTAEKIAAEAAKFPLLEALEKPRVAVLIGGNSKAHRLTPDVARRLAAQLKDLPGALMATASRRTPPESLAVLRAGLGEALWDGEGENPYFAFLALADYILVTEDSVSMTSEALSTGKPVYTVALEGGAKRLNLFHKLLREQGYTRPFAGVLETWSYPPLRDTMEAAQEIRKRLP